MSKNLYRRMKLIDSDGDGVLDTQIFVDALTHTGDTNTKIAFGDDSLVGTAGGVEFLRMVEDTQDAMTFNNGATDVDLALNKLTTGSFLSYDSGTDVLTIGGATNVVNGGVTFADGTTDVDIASHDATNGLKLGGVLVAATAAEINGALDLSARYIAAGSTLAVTSALHNGKVIKLDTAAGSTCTLPAATGSGARFTFRVSVIATSNSHIIKVANSSDTMTGILLTLSDDPATVKGFIASGTSDTITLNRTTTGSTALGEYIVLEDSATNLWHVSGVTASTGTEATPFSATV